MNKLILPSCLRAELEALALRVYPYEACGLIIGRNGSTHPRAHRVLQTRNVDFKRATDRYLMPPDDFRAADQDAFAEGLEIIGVWHSHPDHFARPSELDRECAWEGWSYVIVAVTRSGVTDLRSWRLQESAFLEESIES
jgi:proteasome lid subunit RPN8/RPN11